MYLRMKNASSRQGKQERFAELPAEYSHLYLAIEGRLAAVICIEDPLRPEARDVIKHLKEARYPARSS